MLTEERVHTLPRIAHHFTGVVMREQEAEAAGEEVPASPALRPTATNGERRRTGAGWES